MYYDCYKTAIHCFNKKLLAFTDNRKFFSDTLLN